MWDKRFLKVTLSKIFHVLCCLTKENRMKSIGSNGRLQWVVILFKRLCKTKAQLGKSLLLVLGGGGSADFDLSSVSLFLCLGKIFLSDYIDFNKPSIASPYYYMIGSMGYVPYILTGFGAIMTFAGSESKNRRKRPPTKSGEYEKFKFNNHNVFFKLLLHIILFNFQNRKPET